MFGFTLIDGIIRLVIDKCMGLIESYRLLTMRYPRSVGGLSSISCSCIVNWGGGAYNSISNMYYVT